MSYASNFRGLRKKIESSSGTIHLRPDRPQMNTKPPTRQRREAAAVVLRSRCKSAAGGLLIC